MNIISVCRLFGIYLAIFSGISMAGGQAPDWVRKRPVSRLYYIGIGVAAKDTGLSARKDYIEIARDKALADIASQISVKVSSEVFDMVVEKSGVIADEFRSRIESSSKVELEDVELVDTWGDEGEYWVYYRISKTFREEKISKAVSLSLGLMADARKNERMGNIGKALSLYVRALEPIREYIGEPLETTYNGSKIYLANEIYNSLNNLLGKMVLTAENDSQDVGIGRAAAFPLTVSVSYDADDRQSRPLPGVPIKFMFIKGSGDLGERASTDNDGKASCLVEKVTGGEKIQIVTAMVDAGFGLERDRTDGIMETILKGLPSKKIQFVFNVSGPQICLRVDEIHNRRELDIPRLGPGLKKAFADRACTFVDEISDADLVIDVKAQSRNGSKLSDRYYSAFVDVTISVRDMSTGDIAYANTLEDVKGFGLDFDKAGLDAFKNAVQIMSDEILPELMGKI